MNIEVANGEIVDKITILCIKLKKMNDKEKLVNVQYEYKTLLPIMHKIGIQENDPLYQELLEINKKLWVIEDQLRIKEAAKEFDNEFIELARSVYFTNDERSEIKKKINVLTGSKVIEEKEYVKYKIS